MCVYVTRMSKLSTCVVDQTRKRGRSSMMTSPREREGRPAPKKKKGSCSPHQLVDGTYVQCM